MAIANMTISTQNLKRIIYPIRQIRLFQYIHIIRRLI